MTDQERPGDHEKAQALEISDLHAGYGRRLVLREVSFAVPRSGITAVIGHNGAGKTTLLDAIFGLLPVRQGHIRIAGSLVPRPTPKQLLGMGVVYVPQGGQLFDDLTVMENLQAAALTIGRHQRGPGIKQAISAMPVLHDRLRQRVATLSGGERQLVAIAMTRLFNPQILLLDEPSLGLTPALVHKTFDSIRALATKEAVSVLIVEQKVREILRIADDVVVLREGRVSYDGPSRQLLDDNSALRNVYL